MLSRLAFSRRKFSILHQALNLHNKSDPSYLIARADPTLPLEGHGANVVKTAASQVETTVLSNGVTVVSESPRFPGTVNLNVTMDIGTRDEDRESSGAMLSLKNTYLKTVLTTNEVVNYGMVQMTGGSSDMVYDQETSQYKTSCLAHDVVDLFSMITDCALEPKNVVAASVGMEKNKHSHATETQHDTGVGFKDLLSRTAYGMTGLGMPHNGLKANVGNLNASVLQKFQLSHIRPEKISIGGAGVENHQQLVE